MRGFLVERVDDEFVLARCQRCQVDRLRTFGAVRAIDGADQPSIRPELVNDEIDPMLVCLSEDCSFLREGDRVDVVVAWAECSFLSETCDQLDWLCPPAAAEL